MDPVPFGINLLSLLDDEAVRPLRPCLELARTAGAQCVILGSHPDGVSLLRGESAGSARLHLPDCDLDTLLWTVVGAGLWLGGVDAGRIVFEPREPAARASRWLRTHAALCTRLGAGILSYDTASSSPGSPTAAKAGEIEQLAALSLELAERYGLRLAVRPRLGGVIETFDDVCYYLALEQDFRLGVVVDTGYFAALGQPGWELLGRAAMRVPLLVWSDHRPRPNAPGEWRPVELGQGKAPLELYLTALKSARHRPLQVLSIPPRPAGEQPETLARAAHYLSLIWRRAKVDATPA